MDLKFYPDPSLKQKCSPVDFALPGEREKILGQLGQMRAIMRKLGGAGLAANQVGLTSRMFVLASRQGQPFVNPKITKLLGQRRRMVEGCLSIPDFFEETSRYDSVEVEYVDPDTGTTSTTRLVGFLAQAVQHEMGHLDGKFFVDDSTARGAKDRAQAHMRKLRQTGKLNKYRSAVAQALSFYEETKHLLDAPVSAL